MEALALRFLGPKIVGAIPWRLLAVLALVAGIVASYWAINDRAYDRAKAADKVVLDRITATQLAVNKAAATNKARVETAQSTVTKESDHANLAAIAGIQSDYDRYRLLHPAAKGAAVACVVPRVPGSPAVAADTSGAVAAQPVADIVDIAEAGDVWREQVVGWIDWYNKQAAVSRTPDVPAPASPSQ